MNNQFLNTTGLIKGMLGGVVNQLIKYPENREVLTNYRLVKDLTPDYASIKNRIGIYQDKTGRKMVIKKKSAYLPDLEQVFLANEASILNILKDLKKINLAPKFIDFEVKNGQAILTTELIDGKTSDQLPQKFRLMMVKETLESLKQLADNLPEKSVPQMPKTRNWLYGAVFLPKLIKLIIKSPDNFTSYLRIGGLFYLNLAAGSWKKYKLGLVHRDLYPDNILYSPKDGLRLLDWESAVLSDPLYDLAQVAMIYTREFGTPEMVKILHQHLNDNTERKRFIALSIYNSVQILAHHKSSNKEFIEVNKFLDQLLNKIAPEIIYKKSPFEIINGLTLDAISLFYKLTGISKYSRGKKIVLCYHSVGNNGWRFATRINDFKKQIEFLKKNYKIVGLSDLLKKNKNGIHISFDDGYLDVFQNALPILGKSPATMFALGNYKKANRGELDNNLEIMDFKILEKLSQKGWEIGSHTMTHANLRRISDAKLKTEIFESKSNLEKNLNIEIKYLAYPKGGYSNKIAEYAKLAGYEAAFTVDGKDLKIENMMLLDRIPTEGEMSIDQFEAMLSPLGIFITKIYMRLLQIKEHFGIRNRIDLILTDMLIKRFVVR